MISVIDVIHHPSPKDIVRAEVKDRSRGLGSVQWYRAILDEAHVIKGHKQVGKTWVGLFFFTGRKGREGNVAIGLDWWFV